MANTRRLPGGTSGSDSATHSNAPSVIDDEPTMPHVMPEHLHSADGPAPPPAPAAPSGSTRPVLGAPPVPALPPLSPGEEHSVRGSFSSAPPLGQVDATHIRRRVGRYRILTEVASGGMATVYLAQMRGRGGFEKTVALKCIHPHMAKDPKFVSMFLDEARVASQVSHPHLTQIFDFGRHRGTYFIAMEYLVGETLAQITEALRAQPGFRKGPDYPAFVARILNDACEGVHAAHEMTDAHGNLLEVVHRDISPRNMLLTYDGCIKVMDFGIARAKHQTHRTETGEIKGSLGYIAPEQISQREIDRRADIWSIGVIGWELLTGRRLFQGRNSAQTLYAVLSEPIPPAHQLRAGVPAELSAIVARALQREPEGRFPTARDMARALQHCFAQNGGLPSLGQVSDRMQQLFPGGRTEHLQRLQAAQQESKRSSATTWRKTLVGWAGGIAAACAIGAALAIYTQPQDAPPRSSGPTSSAEIGSSSLPAAPPPPVQPALAKAPPAAPEEQTVVPPPTSSSSTQAESDARRRSRRRAQTRRARAQSRNAKPGRLNLAAPDGWAVVYQGGTRLGQTPLSVSLPAGRHRLEIAPYGRGPRQRIQVDIRPEKTTRRTVQLGAAPP